MFFSLFGNRVRPRSFVYTPRYYDPEKEKDRRERMQFDQSTWQRKYAVRRGMNPFFLMVLVAVVAALMYTMNHNALQHLKASDITLTPADVPVQTYNPDVPE